MRNGIGIGTLVYSLAAMTIGAWARDDEKIALEKLPAAVMKTIKGKFADAKIKSASSEVEHGKTIYEVELIRNGAEIDVALSSTGTILEIEKEIKTADLPKAVSDALKTKYPNGMVKKVEEITVGETKSYEVGVEFAVGKNIDVTFDPNGTILEDEDDDTEPGDD